MSHSQIEEMRNFIQMIKEEFEQSSLWLGKSATLHDQTVIRRGARLARSYVLNVFGSQDQGLAT